MQAHGSFLLLACLLSSAVAATEVIIGPLPAQASRDETVPSPWRVERLDANIPATRYRLRDWDGVTAIEARAEASMALLARPLVIVDLEKTPILCWQWRIEAPLVGADMARKSGDDYAARVYVSFSIPPAQLSFITRAAIGLARSIYGEHVPDAAINYVWDNRYPSGTRQFNTYTDRVHMVVMRSGGQQAGRWVRERANVLADFRQAFGSSTPSLVALAVAADTDNTGESAHSGFANFRFVSRADTCDASPQAVAPSVPQVAVILFPESPIWGNA